MNFIDSDQKNFVFERQDTKFLSGGDDIYNNALNLSSGSEASGKKSQ